MTPEAMRREPQGYSETEVEVRERLRRGDMYRYPYGFQTPQDSVLKFLLEEGEARIKVIGEEQWVVQGNVISRITRHPTFQFPWLVVKAVQRQFFEED